MSRRLDRHRHRRRRQRPCRLLGRRNLEITVNLSSTGDSACHAAWLRPRETEQESFSVHLMAGAVSAPSWTAPVCRLSLLDWGAGKASSFFTFATAGPLTWSDGMSARARWELGSLPTGLAWFCTTTGRCRERCHRTWIDFHRLYFVPRL